MPEGRRLFPALSVEENLMLGAFRPAARTQIKPNLAFVYGVFQCAGAPSAAGFEHERRRAADGGARARADVGADLPPDRRRPSVGLAPILVNEVIAKIRELKERRGLTILMAEQNFNQAIRIADRAYVMVHGRIEFEGSTADLADNPMIKRYYLGG